MREFSCAKGVSHIHHTLYSLYLGLKQLCNQALGFNDLATCAQIEMLLQDLDREFGLYRSLIEEDIDIAHNKEIENEFIRIDTNVNQAKTHLMSLVKPASPSTANYSQDSSLTEFLIHQRQVLQTLTDVRTNTATSDSDLKLPPIKIPQFSGNFKDWPSFRDLFEATVIKNTHISDIQRLQYLRSLVTDEAATIINSLPLTAANYHVAWENLTRRYEKPYLIVRSIIKNFVNIESVSPNSLNLRNVVNSFNETFQLLDSQGDYAKSKDPWVISLMLDKVDKDTCKSWAEHSSTIGEPSLNVFLDFLNDKCSALELYRPEPNVSNKSVSQPRNVSKGFRVHAAGPLKCFYCDDSHFFSKCQKFLSLLSHQSEKAISNASRCYSCFGKGHCIQDCRSTRNCSHCNERHHSLLHSSEKQKPPSHQNKPSNSQKDHQLSQSSKLPESSSSNSGSTSFLNICSTQSSSSSMILPTALVVLNDVHGSPVQVRALLDTGSQVSAISENLLKRLGLPRSQSRVPIVGLAGGGSVHSKGKLTLSIRSLKQSQDHSSICL